MNKTILDALSFRYAIKKYNPEKKVSSEDLHVLMESIRLAPSSFGLQPYTVIHVTNPELRKKLRAAAWDQAQVTDSSDFFVFAVSTNLSHTSVDEFMQLVSKIQNVPVDSLGGYAAMINGSIDAKDTTGRIAWAARQAYLGLGFLLESAAIMKIDASPMEGFDPALFDEILGLKDKNLTSVVMASVGYRDENDDYVKRPKVRKAMESMFITK
jgi:nitroreductase